MAPGSGGVMRLYEIEVRRRRRDLAAEPLPTRRNLGAPAEAIAALHAILDGQVVESLVVLHVDARLRLVGYEVVARGGRNMVHVEPADVFRGALVAGARSVVVAHNHPSGDPEPSNEDIALTKRLRHAGEILGIELLDHIVITDGAATSFKDRGLV